MAFPHLGMLVYPIDPFPQSPKCASVVVWVGGWGWEMGMFSRDCLK